jgi:hypothetical protein
MDLFGERQLNGRVREYFQGIRIPFALSCHLLVRADVLLTAGTLELNTESKTQINETTTRS